MKRNCERKKLRLSDYDYSQVGSYFITICTYNRNCMFGDILKEKMEPSDIGRIVQKWWGRLPEKFLSISNDEFTIMPNHFHGIIVILDRKPITGVTSLPRILQWFKAMTGNEYSSLVTEGALSVENKKLWQRSYYDHIIRNEKELGKIREYILTNPLRWQLDRENPESPNFDIDHDKYFANIFG